ncbi:hypothetical protein [Planotetraspora kaengkrachanensis]|uniref:Uncharacterized protein n=1 Tax=Planotetraspora kaengkrachanensis TaxID=575193 RepID=A0A8J3M961_9ACTN|nr:hypothetical protein [Planotetraspora kaengkrachanensis]GIG80415.1 hypothetical protein Pka01_35420 [Planotetraspora kaengkrachanensis]
MGLLAWIKRLLIPTYERTSLHYRHQTSFTVRSLPSSLPKAYFEASFDLTWTIAADSQPPSIEETYKVNRRIRDILERVTSGFSVHSVEEVQGEVEMAVYRNSPGIDHRLASVQVKLWVDEKTKTYAEEFEKVLRDNALTEAVFEMKARQARYVRDHLLSDAQIARLWWLDGRADKLPELLKMGSNFEQVVGLIHDGMGSIPAPGEALMIERIAELIKDFLGPLSAQHREILLSQLGHFFNGYEREDLANSLSSLNGNSADTN